MSHLATRANRMFTVKMKYRARNIQQGSTASSIYKSRGVVPYKIHHDGWAQQTHLTERHPAGNTNLLLKLRHATRINRVMARVMRPRGDFIDEQFPTWE